MAWWCAWFTWVWKRAVTLSQSNEIRLDLGNMNLSRALNISQGRFVVLLDFVTSSFNEIQKRSIIYHHYLLYVESKLIRCNNIRNQCQVLFCGRGLISIDVISTSVRSVCRMQAGSTVMDADIGDTLSLTEDLFDLLVIFDLTSAENIIWHV